MAGGGVFDEAAELLEGFDERVAKEAGPEVLKALQKTARSQQTPDGAPWQPSSKGGAVLTGAADAMTLTVTKTSIKVRLDTPYVFHDYGAGGSSETRDAVRAREKAARNRAKGGTKSKFHAPRRKMLPDADDAVPEAIVEVLDAAAKKVFNR